MTKDDEGTDLRHAAKLLALSLTDEMLDSLRADYGNTNVAVLRHWRDEVLAQGAAARSGEEASLRERLTELAIAHHRNPHPEGEGEYGCNGRTCPGVQRLLRFAEAAVALGATAMVQEQLSPEEAGALVRGLEDMRAGRISSLDQDDGRTLKVFLKQGKET